jgi:hypothetical protein
VAFYPTHAAVLAGDAAKLISLLATNGEGGGHSATQADFAGVTPLHVAVGAPKEVAPELVRRKPAILRQSVGRVFIARESCPSLRKLPFSRTVLCRVSCMLHNR